MTLSIESGGEGVTTVRIERPQALNAFDSATLLELGETWRSLDADPAVRCIVLTSAGDRAFSVGSDLKEAVPDYVPVKQALLEPSRAAVLHQPTERTPVIAAIRGYCLGGGFELALGCDLRLAAPSAVFGLPELGVGSYPGAGGVPRLLAALPKAVALEMVLTGERLDAERAYHFGLVSQIVDEPELDEAALSLARRIAAAAPLPVAAVKRTLRMTAERDAANELAVEELLYTAIAYSDDRREGREAFREKRKPAFTGS